jgi:hypothetical protein
MTAAEESTVPDLVLHPPTCPVWCEVEAGHAFQLLDEDNPAVGWFRYHEAARGEVFGVCQVEEVHDGALLVSAVDVTSNLASDWPGATAAEITGLRQAVDSELTAIIAVLNAAEAGQ